MKIQNLFLACLLNTYAFGQDFTTSDHFDGKRFFNIDNMPEKSFFSVLRWKLTTQAKAWPDWIDPTNNTLPARQKDELIATFVNHATVLLQTTCGNILTDPVYSERVSPVSWAGPKRHRAPGVSFEKLPKIHAVVVSHNHYDHLDLATLSRLYDIHRPLIVVPLGNKKLLEEEGITSAVEIDWWKEITLQPGCSITLAPAQHWSARGVFDRFKTLWGSYILKTGAKQIYFAGDTGYGRHFSMIAERYGAMDLSLLPIGAYQPRWFMRPHHMEPKESVMAHSNLKSKATLAIHFGTFQLADEGIDDPKIDLAAALQESKVERQSFRALNEGESWILP